MKPSIDEDAKSRSSFKALVFLCQLESLRRSQRTRQKLSLLKVKAPRPYQRFGNTLRLHSRPGEVSVWERSLQPPAFMIEEFMLSTRRKQKMGNAFYRKIFLPFQYLHRSLLDSVPRMTRCLQIQTQCML